MQIDVNFDFSKFFDKTERGRKYLAYAVAEAINNTAKLVRTAEKEDAGKRLTIRRKSTLAPIGVITRYANHKRGVPYAEIAIAQSKGSKAKGSAGLSRMLLSDLEVGGVKHPATPKAKNVAIPITGGKARPIFPVKIPNKFTFKGMDFQKHTTKAGRGITQTYKVKGGGEHQATGGKVVWRGKNRTFIIPRYGVFLRIGPERGDLELMWAFKKSAKIPELLKFYETAKAVAERHLDDELNHAIIKRLRLT